MDDSVIDAYTGELPLRFSPSFRFASVQLAGFIEADKNQDALGYFPASSGDLTRGTGVPVDPAS